MRFLALFALIGCAASLLAARTKDYEDRPFTWYRSAEAREIGRNIVSWQCDRGDWPKNTDTVSRPRPEGTPCKGTFDNGATVGELRILAKLVTATEDSTFRTAFDKGLAHILEAQYANGGWPQSYPPGSGYARHITFNDNTGVNLAEFVRDVAEKPEFEFVPKSERGLADKAFQRAIDCMLKTQIRVDGELTVWCAQHDSVTFEPRPARTYELVSLSGAESAGILRLLMSLKHPNPEVKQAIEAGVRWFQKVKISGFRQTREGGERKIVPDSSAAPLWARFYEVGTNRPIFSGRDGIKRYSIDEIEAERRNGYAWYGDWGEAVLRGFEKWKSEVTPSP